MIYDLAALLAERKRREDDAAKRQAEMSRRYSEMAAELRKPFHPAQAAFYRRREGQGRKRAACTTRQSGKTSGYTRESLARALERPNTRQVYCISTREEAVKRAWRNDTEEGWTQLISKLGLEVASTRKAFEQGHGDLVIDGQYLSIEFRNGSALDIFAADDETAINKLRGVQKDGIAIDEAQQFPYLEKFATSVSEGCLAKRQGEIWLMGTPSEFLAGLFFDVTRDDDLMSRAPGWEVHSWSVLDNPGFGATREERYAKTLGLIIAERHLDHDDLPADVIREWLGKWVATEGRYVYRIQSRTDDELCYAPVRETSEVPSELALVGTSSWYDHAAAMADLPRCIPNTRRPIQWEFGMGVDFGWFPDPFAITAAAWSQQIDEVYELWSWKRTRLVTDRQRDVLFWFWGLGVEIMVGDPAGKRDDMEGWQQAFGLPIIPADKHQKPLWIEMVNGEIAARRWRYRRGSVLLHEHRHLLWHKVGQRIEEHADRKLVDGTVPGNHCSDGGTYLIRHLIGRRAEVPPPPPAKDSPEWDAREERRMRQVVDEYEQQREAVEDSGDPETWYGY